jgi:hypothetical protein
MNGSNRVLACRTTATSAQCACRPRVLGVRCFIAGGVESFAVNTLDCTKDRAFGRIASAQLFASIGPTRLWNRNAHAVRRLVLYRDEADFEERIGDILHLCSIQSRICSHPKDVIHDAISVR